MGAKNKVENLLRTYLRELKKQTEAIRPQNKAMPTVEEITAIIYIKRLAVCINSCVELRVPADIGAMHDFVGFTSQKSQILKSLKQKRVKGQRDRVKIRSLTRKPGTVYLFSYGLRSKTKQSS